MPSSVSDVVSKLGGNAALFDNLGAVLGAGLEQYLPQDSELRNPGALDGRCVAVDFSDQRKWYTSIAMFDDYASAFNGEAVLTPLEYVLVCIYDAFRKSDRKGSKAYNDLVVIFNRLLAEPYQVGLLCARLRTQDGAELAAPARVRMQWFLQTSVWSGQNLINTCATVIFPQLKNKVVFALLSGVVGEGPAANDSILTTIGGQLLPVESRAAALEGVYAAIQESVGSTIPVRDERKKHLCAELTRKIGGDLWVIKAISDITHEDTADRLYGWWSEEVARVADQGTSSKLQRQVKEHFPSRGFSTRGVVMKEGRSVPNTPAGSRAYSRADEHHPLLGRGEAADAKQGCCAIL